MSFSESGFSSPVVLVENGVDGADGLNVSSVNIYLRANSLPTSKPSGDTTFTFSTGAVAFTTANGWSATIPASGGDNLYVRTATASSTGSTDTIADTEWSAVGLVAQKGDTGSSGSDAKVVSLTAANYVIVYDAAGSNPSPSTSITLTATSQNFTNAYFKFTGDGLTDETSFTDGSGANSDTFTYTVPASYFATPQTIRVGVSEGDQTELAFDTITITAIKPGANGTDGLDALTLIMSNEAHTLPVTAAGVVTYTGSGTTIRLYEGATELAYDGTGTSNSTWKVTTSASNITAGTLTDSGDYVTVGDHSEMTATNASITYTITGKRADGTAISLTKTQSFSQSIQGAAGAPGDAGADGPGIVYRGE